ncbi:DHA2 family efflux MFS transporter permease subunit [Nocardioides sp.]|uniref:DHA2 family efflux MFS transporter permease subunit n=1 Tax=Nocardioides sp. TaxID=35761 RepID=UPI0026146804|nr:DHA2 family efflux MFS transporter permease subunit [Nocardioides sp.]
MTEDLAQAQQPEAPTGAPHSDKLDARVLIIAGVVVVGSIMSILDITVVSVALTTFQSTFHASAAQVAWTMTGYTLALAAVIPATGWAAERFGTKRLYLAAIVFFAVGSAMCATASNLEMLVLWRVVQGFGGGMLMPIGMTILTRAAGPDRVGRVMAVLGIPMLLGPICGPILGGLLIDKASWHWIFLINVPIGIAAFIYALLALPQDKPQATERFDLLGMVLLSPGLALLLYGVSSVPEEGTFWAAKVMITAIAGVVLIVAFVFWALSKRNPEPLVDLRLFKNKDLTVSVVTMALFCMAFFGCSLLIPLYFQQVRGETALAAGVLLIPQGIGAMVTMPIAGVLADKIGPGKIVMSGIVLIVISFAMWAPLDGHTSYPYLLGALFVQGLGMGMTMMPTFSAGLATLRDHTIARGSTLMNINQQVAGSIGTAVFTVLLTNGLTGNSTLKLASAVDQAGNDQSLLASVLQKFGVSADKLPSLLAGAPDEMGGVFGNVFIVAAVLAACCLIPAFFLPRHAAEKTGDQPVMMH